MCMKIIRTSIMLCGLAVVLPNPPEDAGARLNVSPSSLEMASAAASAVNDARGFCGREPRVCETTRFIAQRLEVKAKYAARLVYEWASDDKDKATPAPRRKPAQQAKADPLITGSAPATAKPARRSQNTLHIEDLIPEWRSPLQPRTS